MCKQETPDVRSRFQTRPVDCNIPYSLHREIVTQGILLLRITKKHIQYYSILLYICVYIQCICI